MEKTILDLTENDLEEGEVRETKIWDKRLIIKKVNGKIEVSIEN